MAWLESVRAPEIGAERTDGPILIGIRAHVLLRYTCFGVLLLASLMFYVWSRVDVRSTATDMASSVAYLDGLVIERERLELELATRRDVGRLKLAAEAMGLEQAQRVVEVVLP